MLDLVNSYRGIQSTDANSKVPGMTKTILNVGTPMPTTFQYFKRADSDGSSTAGDDNSSSTSTTSSKSSKCTGTKQQCQKPADHGLSVTVGIAVAVPVVVVTVILAVILYLVYRRSQREALEDNDPDFEGDAEFMNSTYPTHMMATQPNYFPTDPNREVKQEFKQEYYQPRPPATNPFNNSSLNSSRIASGWDVNPFHLPENNEANSLRNFAKEIENDGRGGYNLASQSRNASHSSLELYNSNPSTSNRNTMQQRSTMDVMSFANEPYQEKDTHMSSLIYSKDTSDPDTISKEKYTTHETETPIRGENSTETEDFDFEVNEKQIPKVNIIDNNTPPMNEKSVDFDSDLSPDEEENIKRMRSIYKVYLDRHDTQKSKFQPPADEEPKEHELNQVQPESYGNKKYQNTIQQDQPQNEPHMEQSPNNNEIKHEFISSQLYGDQQSQTSSNIKDNTNNTLVVPDDNNNRNTSYRVASSIYSEMPRFSTTDLPPLPQGQGQIINQQQYPYIQQPAQSYGAPMQNYQNRPQQQRMQPNFYGPPGSYMPHSGSHPNMLENIGELPTAAQFSYSTGAAHSLTSFRQPSKQQAQMQAARLNGTALNPMDNPEMFYSQTGDQLMAPSYSTNDMMSVATNNSQNTALLPHQMRNSVVMTNPSQLQSDTLYRPAGSFRKLNESNSRNNSFTNQGMANSYQQHLQQQIQSRVSGLLEPSDVIQPPSIAGILPHSGSQEDLRKQLVSSQNYNVDM